MGARNFRQAICLYRRIIEMKLIIKCLASFTSLISYKLVLRFTPWQLSFAGVLQALHDIADSIDNQFTVINHI